VLDKPVPSLLASAGRFFRLVGVSWQHLMLLGWIFRQVFVGEFDPGSGRTLAACLTHASRAERPFGVLERRTGE
jgi:hypothetical protein